MGFFSKIKRILNLDIELYKTQKYIQDIQQRSDEIKLLLAKQVIFQNNGLPANINIQKTEFKVFSQWGDDGIVQYLINNLEIKNHTFIEFGVENYTESNTRLLVLNNNWSGLVIDGSEQNIQYIKSDSISWKYDLKSVCAFINRENINSIISSAKFDREVGILSIDIDGNDYWIWDAIDVINPIIVVVEYNALFGNARPITIPYQPNFNRSKAHFSNLYFGASLPALCHLAKNKKYCFIGTNSNGVNAYFIREDVRNGFKNISLEEGFTKSKFSESRDKNGRLSYLTHEERLSLIKGLPVINVCTGSTEML